MSDLKDKTVCVVDCGLFVSFARTLAREFGKVLYFSPWVSAFPTSNTLLIGDGFDDLERIKRPFDHIDDVDLWCFPDVYFSDWQRLLLRLGKRVWGGRYAERLELNRYQAKHILKSLGLPVNRYEVVTGLSALRDYLKAHENVWVKISNTRGDFETFHSVNYDLSEPKLDEIEYKLGAKKYVMNFLIEDSIDDAVEVGYDGFTVDGKYADISLMGYEIKDAGYMGAVMPYRDLPEPIRVVNEALSPWLESQQYRGFMSTELRITKDGTPYLTDFCARAGSPPSEVYQEIYTNWGEIIWNGAEGRMVQPNPVAMFGVEVMIHSSWADKNWQALDIPSDIEQWVKLRNHARILGRDYCVPQSVGLPEIGAVIGLGDTLLEAVKATKEHADKIEGYYVELKMDSLGKSIDQVLKGEEFGIQFGDGLPSHEEIEMAVAEE